MLPMSAPPPPALVVLKGSLIAKASPDAALQGDGDGISFEQEGEKWADWPNRLVQPILPSFPFPV